MNGQAFAFHYALPVDSAGDSCPTAGPSRTSASSRRCWSRTNEPIARNLARQLTVFATGAPVRFSDREADREDPRQRPSARPVRRAQPSSTRSCRATFSGTSEEKEPAMTTNANPAASCTAPFVSSRRPISRRRFLRRLGRGDGAAVSGFDDRTVRAVSRADPRRPRCRAADVLHLQQPRRAARAVLPQGRRPRLHPLALSEAARGAPRDFTVLSGVSHPFVDGGHPSDVCFLTAAPHPASSSFRNTISLDQLVAERIGTFTRFPRSPSRSTAARSLSWTGTGVAIPPEEPGVRGVQAALPAGHAQPRSSAQIRNLDTGRSILDAVAEQAKDLQRNVGARDRGRLDQYFTSVRDLEHRLQESRGWESKPKPVVKASPADRSGQPRPVHGQGADHVRPGAPGLRDRFHPRDHADAQQRRHAGRANSPARPSPTAITTCRTTAWPRTSWRSSKSSTNGT